jgi:hydrogenase maturation protease
VEVVEHNGEPAGLLDLWEGAHLAIVVDAVRPSGDGPGGFHRVEVEVDAGLPRLGAARAVSSHGVGPGDVVELARALNRLPERLVLYGIEGTDFSPGIGCSPELEPSLVAVADRILEEVTR